MKSGDHFELDDACLQRVAAQHSLCQVFTEKVFSVLVLFVRYIVRIGNSITFVETVVCIGEWSRRGRGRSEDNSSASCLAAGAITIMIVVAAFAIPYFSSDVPGKRV